MFKSLNETAPTVFIRNVFLAYKNQQVFENFDFTLAANRWSCLLGQSGIGKSTLLKILANLVHKDASFQAAIHCNNPHSVHQQIAYMGQSDLLLPWLTAIDNALLPFKLGKEKKLFAKYKQKAKELFTKTGLAGAEEKLPCQLSGGMRQRVALIRTLLQAKPIVLMDEPFSALDAITRFQLQELAATLLQNRTVLFITHDPAEALRLAHHIYILSGRPATISKHFELKTATPRDPTEYLSIQKELFTELIKANDEL